MYLLTTFKRKKGDKNKRTRKDKGLKRTTNNKAAKTVSTKVHHNYLKARTVRSLTAPIVDAAREVRHWTALGHEMTKTKSTKSKGNVGSTVRTARNAVGLVKDLGRFSNNKLIQFRRSRKDKGKKRGTYNKALGVAKKAGQLATGAALLGGGLYATKKLVNTGYLPKLIGKADDPLVKRSRDALKSSMHEGATKTTAAIIPATTIGATTVGADYLIDRKNDMPLTRKTRKLLRG
jgi:hypothetical protein